MKKLSGLIAVLAVAAVVAGCGGTGSSGPAKSVALTAKDMAFAAKEVTVENGKAVKLVFNNQDGQLHDFSVDKIPVKVSEDHKDGHDMGGAKPDLHVSAEAGKTGEVEFTPTKAGTYTFYCTVPGHKDAGMVGSLIVK
jgi:uncharacterized cupredoxin-like copper-binding protein